MIILTLRQELELWKRVDKNGPLPEFDPSLGPCWIWMGPPTDSGYGQLNIKGRNVKSHTILYVMYKGAVPDDCELDHLCRVRICCNPDHLEAVSHKVNMQRSPLLFKTHCKRGHELVDDNVYKYFEPHRRSPKRICKQCNRIREHRYA